MGKGGKRAGAGRPAWLSKDEKLVRVTVMLPPAYVEWAKSESSDRLNVSEGLRNLLGELDQLKGAGS
jgi:hypothetical protein